MKNLDGKMSIDILGKERDVVANFGVAETLERKVFKRPILTVLQKAAGEEQEIYFHEVVDTIVVGLNANKDTRFSRDEIGEYVFQKGLSSFVTFYIDYLATVLTGGSLEEAQTSQNESVLDKKK